MLSSTCHLIVFERLRIAIHLVLDALDFFYQFIIFKVLIIILCNIRLSILITKTFKNINFSSGIMDDWSLNANQYFKTSSANFYEFEIMI